MAWVSERKGAKPGWESGPPLLGVVAGRGFRGSVERNRARRRVRGCVMELRHLLEPGRSYLIECRPGTEKTNYQKLVIEIEAILSRI